jgi:hypothetical protein
MDFNSDDKPQARREVIISDLRHNRDVETGEEAYEEEAPEPAAPAAPEPPAQPEPVAQAAVQDLAEAATGAEGATLAAEPPVADGNGAELEQVDFGAEGSPYTEEEMRAAEREQLRQLISLGLVNYLRYQLTMVLNFALLNLGSAADPVTGLVSKNLPQAKLAIDVFEFLVARMDPEMEPAERTQMRALVHDLKYAFMQAAQESIPPPPTGEA